MNVLTNILCNCWLNIREVYKIVVILRCGSGWFMDMDIYIYIYICIYIRSPATCHLGLLRETFTLLYSRRVCVCVYIYIYSTADVIIYIYI